MPKIIHYRNKCIGCGVCYEMQPELWRMSKKDGKATLLKGDQKNKVYVRDITDDQVEKTKEVVKACPVNVIKVS